jgi:hypothetical protein
MKPTDREPQRVVVFSKEECEYLIQELNDFHPARWFHRPKINSIPTSGTDAAEYYFCGDKQQPRDFNAYLRSIAPEIEGATLGEAVINKYPVGGFMSEHIDIAQYRYNMPIPLQSLGDGLFLGDTFIEDDAGVGTIFPAKSPPHEVPVVKHLRYLVIYLYD